MRLSSVEAVDENPIGVAACDGKTTAVGINVGNCRMRVGIDSEIGIEYPLAAEFACASTPVEQTELAHANAPTFPELNMANAARLPGSNPKPIGCPAALAGSNRLLIEVHGLVVQSSSAVLLLWLSSANGC